MLGQIQILALGLLYISGKKKYFLNNRIEFIASIQSLVPSPFFKESDKTWEGDFYKILNYSDKLWQRGIESENLKDFFCYLLSMLVRNPYQCLDYTKTKE